MYNKTAIRLLNFPLREWITTERNAKKEYLDSNSNYWNCSTQSSTHNIFSLKSNGSTFSVGDRSSHAMTIREKLLDDKKAKIKNEIENKREKLIKKKKEFEMIKEKRTEKYNKVSEMRKIKLKIHKLSKKEDICASFDTKNYLFNQKVEEYFQSNRFIKKQINFHSNFRFGNKHYGVAHNRLDMMMSLDAKVSKSA